MAEPTDPPKSLTRRFGRWLLEALAVEPKGRAAKEGQPEQHSWWQVMHMTGVDYFSTLGYIPAISGLDAHPPRGGTRCRPASARIKDGAPDPTVPASSRTGRTSKDATEYLVEKGSRSSAATRQVGGVSRPSPRRAIHKPNQEEGPGLLAPGS